MKIRCAICGIFFKSARVHAVTCGSACRKQMSRIVTKCDNSLPEGPFNVGYFDPNWKFWTRSNKGMGRSPDQHYECLDYRVIARMPFGRIFADNAVMFMWVYPSLQRQGYAVLEAFGFEPQEAPAFVWVKTTKDGEKLVMSTGYTTRMGSEVCLLGRRGKGLKRLDAGVRQTQTHPRTLRHSEKPHQFRNDIVRLYGDVPRIEGFTRHTADGWTGWGHEAGKFGQGVAP